jgi:hypothetical protein
MFVGPLGLVLSLGLAIASRLEVTLLGPPFILRIYLFGIFNSAPW